VATYKPYRQFVEQRPFKDVKAFFERGRDDRYKIMFYDRWQDFNQTEPERIVQ